MNDTLYVGIDVGSNDNVVYIMKPDGNKLSNFKVRNSRDGSAVLVKSIAKALSELGLSSVRIGIESTGIYGDGLIYFLREDGSLASFQGRSLSLIQSVLPNLRNLMMTLKRTITSTLLSLPIACGLEESTTAFLKAITAMMLLKS